MLEVQLVKRNSSVGGIVKLRFNRGTEVAAETANGNDALCGCCKDQCVLRDVLRHCKDNADCKPTERPPLVEPILMPCLAR